MAITYPISMPPLGISAFTPRKAETGGMTQSPYTGEQEIYAYPGQWWEFDVSLARASMLQAGAVEAFTGLLRGTYGTFLMGDPMRPVPFGLAAASPGTPVVNGAQSKGSDVLNIKNGGASKAGWLLEGDYIQLGTGLDTHLHQVLLDANTDASGDTALQLWPNLREDVVDGATVIVSGCVGIFRMTQPKQQVVRSPGPFTDFNFTAIEDI